MTIARAMGRSTNDAHYQIADDQLAVGSTLGGPKVVIILKASGAIEKVYSIDSGETLFGTISFRHYDAVTGMHLGQDDPGTFDIHGEHQVHSYTLTNHVGVREVIFVYNAGSLGPETLDVPGVYLWIELTNNSPEPVELLTYAYCLLRGTTTHDVVASYDDALHALLVWNTSNPNLARLFGCSEKPESHETTLDSAKAISWVAPGPLSGQTTAAFDPLGAMQHRHRLQPGEKCSFYYLVSFGEGHNQAKKNYRASPTAVEAFSLTKDWYKEALSRSVVMTPDSIVNRGVLWAKANMLRVESHAPTGWCFTNDPTRSNNSVARDTAWFGFGADYFTPDFVRESLLAFVRLQEKDGMIVEYYDIRNDKTADYGLNINDNTPLIIMALWHHYNVTGNEAFLREIYPAARKAASYIVSQRNDQGLVWCDATGTADWGIVGWRNVIPNYRLSGATTEVNSECYVALQTVSHMARVLEKHKDSEEFARHAEELKHAINTHLRNPQNSLYYLNIDLNGKPRSDITSDLVFPVMFDVANDRAAAHIVGRLSDADFWTPAGIRTVPRDAPDYTPSGGWGLLGGVWVGVSFWYAFAAAKYSPSFMADALSMSFKNYTSDPRGNNTVPGQFSEWLNGETLVNQGMMLSPWFPPRYLWAAIEGMAGLNLEGGVVSVRPNLAPEWKWLGVHNLPYRGQRLTWFAVRVPDVRIYTNFTFPGDVIPYASFEEDITCDVKAPGDSISLIGLAQDTTIILFVGNMEDRTVVTSVAVDRPLAGRYRLRTYNSLLEEWHEGDDLVSAEEIRQGITIPLERCGFWLLDLRQEV